MRHLVVLCLIAVVLGGLFVVEIARARRDAAFARCRLNLMQLGLSLHTYHAVFKSFPPGTHPNAELPPEKRLSWLALGGQGSFCSGREVLALDTTKAWDSPENLPPKSKVFNPHGEGDQRWSIPRPVGSVSEFQCPSHPFPSHDITSATHYLGIAGVGENAALLPVNDPHIGVFGYDRKTRQDDIKDGLSNTIMVIETTLNNGAWTAGGPATVRGIVPDGQSFFGSGFQFGGTHDGGCMVLLADASVRFLKESLSPNAFLALATIAGGEEVGEFDRE